MCAEYSNVLIQIEESLLVLRGLGIQTSTSSPYFFSSSTTTFIPTTQIQDIVIHEAFKGLEVRFYLAIIVEDATEVVVVFPVRISTSLWSLFMLTLVLAPFAEARDPRRSLERCSEVLV
jgi:hypothetical protein